MRDNKIIAAQVGYGMFGADVVAGTMWDLQRNGLSPYLDRLGLDDWCSAYDGIGFEMAAIGTRSEASVQRAVEENHERTGLRPAAYHGDAPWDDILRDHPDLDVLIVATPDNLHTAPILAALNAGVHVIAEKPLCLDLRECDEIIALAQAKRLIVGADMHKRYDPDHLKIFHELKPQLGPPIHARGVLEEPLEVSTKTFKWVEESDPFTYVGIHWVDLFCHYLQCTPVSLFAIGQKVRLRNEFGKDAFDATQVLVTFREGFSIFFDNNWLTPADFEGPVNQESAFLGSYGKIESDSQYRGLRYWIENKGSRTSNTHFFRNVRRPDGSLACTGYGKDSLVDCLEKVYRIKTQGATAAELAGAYPDAQSQRIPTAIVHAARAVMQRNQEHFEAGHGQPCTATFDEGAITLRDPLRGDEVLVATSV